jgi:GTPase SAR1 family protein
MLTDDVKVVLLGASTVGKTSAVRAFAGQGFVEHYVPTRDFETTTINLPGAVGEASMECVFWDCNPETFVQNPEHILGGATCVVLAYDVTNYDSYLEVCSSWMELVKPPGSAKKKLFIMLLGCKTDMAAQRVVGIKEAEAFASRHGIFFMEISSKTGTNVGLTLTLLRIRTANIMSGLDGGNFNGNRASTASGRWQGQAPPPPTATIVASNGRAPPPPPPPPPAAAASHGKDRDNSKKERDGRRSPLGNDNLARNFALSAQISSSYDSISAILGRVPERGQGRAPAKKEHSRKKSDAAENPVAAAAAVGLPAQRMVSFKGPNAAKVETKSDNSSKVPVFEREYAALRGMFDGRSPNYGGGSPRASMSNHEAFPNRNSNTSPLGASSADVLLRSNGPRLSSFQHGPKNRSMPPKAPLLAASESVRINGSISNPAMSPNEQIEQISPRKLKAYVMERERKKVPAWNQHVIKTKFGTDANEEIRAKKKAPLGYLPPQYRKKKRKVPPPVKHTAPPDLVIDVSLPNGKSGTIEVRAGDNARDLAERYVYDQSLRMRFIPVLTDLIEERVKKFLVEEKRKLFAEKRRQRQAEVIRRRNVASPTVPEPFRLNTAERSRQFEEPPEARVVGKLHIAVGPNKKGTIVIREGDDAGNLVDEFRRVFKIRDAQANLIRERIQTQLNEAANESMQNSSFQSWRSSPSSPKMNTPNVSSRNVSIEHASGRVQADGGQDQYNYRSPENLDERFKSLTPSQSALLRKTLMMGKSPPSAEARRTKASKPLFNLDINIPSSGGESVSKRITVRDGDDPVTLAREFVIENKLPQESQERLTQLLVDGLKKVKR